MNVAGVCGDVVVVVDGHVDVVVDGVVTVAGVDVSAVDGGDGVAGMVAFDVRMTCCMLSLVLLAFIVLLRLMPRLILPMWEVMLVLRGLV